LDTNSNELGLFNRLNIRLRHKVVITSKSNLSISPNVKFDRNCFITARGGEIFIGEGCRFNIDVVLNADIGGKLTFGKNCIVGPRVIFRTANHKFGDVKIPIREQGHTTGNITLGEDVWIGANVVILPNVHIGRGSIIGAGAVVTRSIPEFSIAAGVPAKIIGSRG
jgi:galactoside O-acetyltransferase